jgi:predicted RNase H-like nuclease
MKPASKFSKLRLPGRYIGVDGCPAGWFAVWQIAQPEGLRAGHATLEKSIGYAVFKDISELMAELADARRILIDMPIGLKVDAPRQLESQLRKLLGKKRSSVFPVPARSAVYATSYEQACRLNVSAFGKKLSKQSWNICAKIQQVDQHLIKHPVRRDKLLESHPELAFQRLAGMELEHGKKTKSGIKERLKILAQHNAALPSLYSDILDATRRADVARDDILDAMALMLSVLNCKQLAFEPEHGFDSIPIRMSTFI